MIDPITLVALFGPLIKSGGQALINKFSKGDQYKPASLDDAIKLMQAETEQLKVRASVGDTDSPVYPWVASVVKLQRPIIVYMTISCFLVMTAFGVGAPESLDVVYDLAAMVIFWLFGERTLLKINDK